MILLAIDTSGPLAGVALFRDDIPVYEACVKNSLTHSRNLLPMIEEAFERSDIRKQQTELIAVTTGPGSFTGVRLGVETAKAMAHASGALCVAVDALEATARGGMFFDGIVCPVQDARAGQVYTALFEGKTGRRLSEDCGIMMEELCGILTKENRPCLILGDGSEKMTAVVSKYAGLSSRTVFAPPALNYLRPACAAELAVRNRSNAVTWQELQPMYLRAPQAERQRNLVQAT